MYPKLPFFLSSHAYRDPTVPTTQYNGLCHDSVTSHCITLILIGQTIKLPGKSQNQENRGLFAHQPPLACSTPQYAARVTLKTEHKCAETEPELHNLLVCVLTPCSPATAFAQWPATPGTARAHRPALSPCLLPRTPPKPAMPHDWPGYGPRTAR